MVNYESLSEDKLKQAHNTNFVSPTITLDDWEKVKGYNFEEAFDAAEFFKSFLTTGFQATDLGRAIQVLKEMRKNNAKIFFGFTSNMASCGVRDIITYLCKHKLIDVIVTTIGGVEEDIIKTLKPFVLGDYETPGKFLRDKGVNRTGNIFIPNDRYLYFERFMNPFLERIYQDYQVKQNKIISTREFCYEIGKETNNEESFMYWSYKNDIPVFCPAPTDGSIGDMIYFFKYRRRDFKIDLTDDMVELTNISLNAEKTGILAIGGSIPKHHIANANLFRDGADYAIYLTTAQEFEGSNAGANVEEAISWGKVKDTALRVKVVGDASITFPLLVAGALKLDISFDKSENDSNKRM